MFNFVVTGTVCGLGGERYKVSESQIYGIDGIGGADQLKKIDLTGGLICVQLLRGKKSQSECLSRIGCCLRGQRLQLRISNPRKSMNDQRMQAPLFSFAHQDTRTSNVVLV